MGKPQIEISEEKLASLKEKLAGLPTNPGIYQYKNEAGKIIYIGKAKNLRNRVRSYFQEGRIVDAKTKALVGKIADIEVILVDSEAEALLLEDTLIKKHKPKYNIMLKDDKTFPYVRVTNEDYPRIFPTRKVIRDGSKYFGPFTEVKNIKQLMRTIRQLFKIRSCDLNINNDSITRKKHRVCLDYHIHKCEGPCEGLVSKEKYNDNIRQSIQILLGKTKELEKQLENEMEEYSENLNFEAAAKTRDRLVSLRDYTSKQKIVSSELIDRDIFGLAKIDKTACTLVLKIRDGKLIGKRHYIINNAELENDNDLIQRTLEKWYLESDFIPKEIFLAHEPEELEYISDWLGKLRGKPISIQIPKLGDKKKIVEMANTNAEFILREHLLALAKREQSQPHSVLALQRDLNLKKAPQRIECFDNSHIQGSDLVSSMVVFQDGKPKKSDYRKFIVKTVGGNDDFAAMRETIHRRYKRLIEENQQMPDLVIIDGGKGQLSSACAVLQDLNLLDKFIVIGLAKRLEEVFFPNNPESVLIPKTSSGLKLIQQVRDEAHRFAITFHRKRRDKRTLKTELTEISGIGEKTAQKLLIAFGSVKQIQSKTIEELSLVCGKKNAKLIIDYFLKKPQ